MDGGIQVPSAILVHDELSDLQIKELREKLPAGVPLIDGKTNQLLDEVGEAEREQGRKRIKSRRTLGSFVIKDFGSYDRIRTQKGINEPVDSFNWANYNATTNTEYKDGRAFRTENSSRESKTEPHEDAKQTVSFENQEVRPYHDQVTKEQAEREAYKEYQRRNISKAANEIRTVARTLYDTSDVNSLDNAQLGRVEP